MDGISVAQLEAKSHQTEDLADIGKSVMTVGMVAQGSTVLGSTGMRHRHGLCLQLIFRLGTNLAHDSKDKSPWLLCIYTTADVDNRSSLLDGTEHRLIVLSNLLTYLYPSVDAHR